MQTQPDDVARPAAGGRRLDDSEADGPPAGGAEGTSGRQASRIGWLWRSWAVAALAIAIAFGLGAPSASAQEPAAEPSAVVGSDEPTDDEWADDADEEDASLLLEDCSGVQCGDVDLGAVSFVEEAGPYPVIGITPYFKEGSAFHRGRAQLAGGRCADALKLFDKALASCGDGCEGRQAVLWQRAQALWCSGDRRGGYEVIRALDGVGYPGLAREVRALHREYAAALGERVPSDLPPQIAWDGVDFVRRALTQARALVKQGRVDDGLALADAVERQCRSAALRRQVAAARAQLLVDAGRPDEAAALYARLWREHRGTGFGARVEEQLGKLGAASGQERYQLSRAERLDHLIYLSERRGGGGAAYLKAHRGALANTPRDRAALDGLVTGLGLETARSRGKALVVLDGALEQAQDPLVRARVLFARGKVLRRLNRDDEAIAAYLELAHQHPRDAWADDALVQAGRLMSYQGRHEEVIDLMGAAAALYPDSPLKGTALWQGAWSAWLAGRDAQALRLLDHLAAHFGDERDPSELPVQVKARYWRSRVLARSGRAAEAVEGYRYVIERWPLTYYAAMAWRQIEGLGLDPRVAVPFQPRFDEPVSSVRLKELSAFSTVPAHPRVRHGLELWRIGERGRAKVALLEQMQFEGVPRGVVELVSTFHLLDDDIPASMHVAWRHGTFATAPWGGNARLWGLAYPAPPKVLEAALDVGREVDVDPLLALAVMRHESSFSPGVTSPVGAVGLMQLMPDSARRVNALWYGASGPTTRQLRRSATNIRMGMTMLRLLDGLYTSNLPLMVAGYNAGTGVSSRWLTQFKGFDTDALVEQMTYPLTRAYVKKVIGSYYAYRVLYGDGQPPEIPLSLPKRLGPWGPPPPDLVGLR